MVKVTCTRCGKEFEVKNCKAKSGKDLFCSRFCFDEYRREARPKTKCLNCGKEISMPMSQYLKSDNHYCSTTCRNRYNNAKKNKTLMTLETRKKLSTTRKSRYGVEEPKGYRKSLGRLAHREIAEQILGRKLKPEEVVHHIDCNRLNNDPNNLFIFPSKSEHTKWHALNRKGKAPVLIGGDAQCVMSQESTNE